MSILATALLTSIWHQVVSKSKQFEAAYETQIRYNAQNTAKVDALRDRVVALEGTVEYLRRGDKMMAVSADLDVCRDF